MPASCSFFAEPPVERISTPCAVSCLASSTRPLLSETEIIARAILCGTVMATGFWLRKSVLSRLSIHESMLRELLDSAAQNTPRKNHQSQRRIGRDAKQRIKEGRKGIIAERENRHDPLRAIHHIKVGRFFIRPVPGFAKGRIIGEGMDNRGNYNGPQRVMRKIPDGNCRQSAGKSH